MHLWCRLLKQAQITLNLLRTEISNPKISAQVALEGGFGFNETPLVPPGTKVVIHKKLWQRKSWDPRGVEGWHLRPAMEHYRCYTLYVNKTRAERIADAVEFLPEHNKMPGIFDQEAATHVALYLIEDIENPSLTAPFESIGASKLQAIRNLTDIFKQTTYGREDRFSFLSVGNDILNKTTQENPHKETAQIRVEVKHSNPTKTTALSIMAAKWRRVVRRRGST